MGLRTNPNHRQRRLGYELRKLRLRAKLSTAEAGTHVGLAGPHLNHIEGGKTAISEENLRALAKLYECNSATYVDALLAMRNPTHAGWWDAFKRVVDDRARDLAELEATATSYCGFEAVHVPGLLQAPEYTRALLHSYGGDADDEERYYEYRLKRQEVLSHTNAPSYHAVVHEAALQMQFVGTEVLRKQISHLIEISEVPHVTIQIIPFRSELLPAVGGPFVLFRGRHRELDTVYIEHDVGAEFLADQEMVSRYEEIFRRLSSLALPPLTPASHRDYASRRDSFSLLQHLLYIL